MADYYGGPAHPDSGLPDVAAFVTEDDGSPLSRSRMPSAQYEDVSSHAYLPVACAAGVQFARNPPRRVCCLGPC